MMVYVVTRRPAWFMRTVVCGVFTSADDALTFVNRWLKPSERKKFTIHKHQIDYWVPGMEKAGGDIERITDC